MGVNEIFWLFLAYSAVFLGLILYVIGLGRRQHLLAEELKRLAEGRRDF